MSEKKLSEIWDRIAHDLTTPLCTALMGMESLEAYWEPLVETYQAAKKAGLAVGDIRNDILPVLKEAITTSRDALKYQRLYLEMIGMKLNPVAPTCRQHSISTLIQEAIDSFCGKNGLEARTKLDVNLEEGNLFIDARLLQHVFYNLLMNADYFLAGIDNPHISIVGKETEQGYLISFTHNGEAIDQDQLTCIFDPYYTTINSKLGLGLSFCKEALEIMGGEIHCRPVDAGVEFQITLPLTKE